MSLEELVKDEAFIDRIKKAESLAEIVEILRSEELDVTEAELKSMLDDQDGELTEENLEGVAGGKSRKEWLKVLADILKQTLGPVGFPRPRR